MEFRNLTPFDALAWSVEDVDAEESHVVVVRVGYRLARVTSAPLPGAPDEDDATPTHHCELREGRASPRLAFEDGYFGAPLVSSVRGESDLAPFKPRCDVLVNATAFAPRGEEAARWPVRVRVVQPAGAEVLLDKTLSVCGPRWFERAEEDWSLSEPEPALAVPVRWEHAYGGTSHVPEAELNEACFTNPVGCGWVEARWFDAMERAGHEVPSRLPAPQIEDPRRPVKSLDVVRHPDGVEDAMQMANAVLRYAGAPAGLGAVGRAWTPRLQRAGTYDDAWRQARWPHLPEDFDFAYWNAAPDDQQLEALPPDARFELVNLVSPEHALGGVLRAALPGHRALVLLRMNDGALVPFMMTIDTLIIDAESLAVDVIWRTVFSRELDIRVAEARFEIDPTAPLVRLAAPRAG